MSTRIRISTSISISVRVQNKYSIRISEIKSTRIIQSAVKSTRKRII